MTHEQHLRVLANLRDEHRTWARQLASTLRPSPRSQAAIEKAQQEHQALQYACRFLERVGELGLDE